MPLERCMSSNGALSFLPGSHLTTPITKRFIRKPGGGTGFEEIFPPPTPNLDADFATKSYVLQTCEPGQSFLCYSLNRTRRVTLGDLVLIHGNVVHKSERNTSSQTRYAYTFHMIDSPPHAYYDEKNWLQPTSSMTFPKVLDVPNDITHEGSGKV